ncbi:MAG: riboflavin biosynthesis protein RibF [Bacteroidales bacterium]|nr:riboflavin biosynthesis protein RibF [Bacteroidales bacterium]
MKVLKNIQNFPKLSYPVISVGRYDGVHKGHQNILKKMHDIALAKKGQKVVVTFDPGPEEILFEKNKDEIKLLSTLDEKIELLEQFGVDYLIIIPFSLAFSRTTSFDFVKTILVDQLHIKEFVMGYDNRYGYDRSGDFRLMNKLAQTYHFLVTEVAMEDVRKFNVSSIRIRKYLSDGNIAAANKFLGYPYQMSGKVVKGNQIGRTIGFPTANIDVKEKYKYKLMPSGVYIVEVIINKKKLFGMANIGYRPTIQMQKHELTAEVNIFKFNQDIYGAEISIHFLERIREEQKFNGIKDLKEQLAKDKTLSLLAIEHLK